jgi:hypothetical protein
MDNIDVQPGERPGKQAVATDEIDGIHFPEYKIAYGDKENVTYVDFNNPLPVNNSQPITLGETAKIQQEDIIEAIEDVVIQLKIMNLHFQTMTGEKITRGDLDV